MHPVAQVHSIDSKRVAFVSQAACSLFGLISTAFCLSCDYQHRKLAFAGHEAIPTTLQGKQQQEEEDDCSMTSPLPVRQLNTSSQTVNRVSGAKRIAPTLLVTGNQMQSTLISLSPTLLESFDDVGANWAFSRHCTPVCVCSSWSKKALLTCISGSDQGC